MWKKSILLLLLILAQTVFLFAADRNFKRTAKAQVNLMRETLPAKGISPNHVDALVHVMEAIEFNVSLHVNSVATLLMIFNCVAVTLAFPKRG